MKKFLLALLATTLATPALAAQQPVTQLSSVTASREALRTAINTQLSAVQSNFDEVYAIIDAGPVYVNTTAPADTKVVWIDTDQDNAIKVYVGGVWTVVGAGGIAGDDLGSATYGDVVALWTTCTGYLKSDGTCDTPSGSATYPSVAGVANWTGSAWGTSYTVGTAANNLVRLNASAQLPAVSADLLTITDTNSRFTTDTVGAALVQIGEFNASLPRLVSGAGLTLTEDTPSAGTDTISVSANTYQAYDADWLGITANGAALVSAANYAAMRTLLDLEVGVDFNAYSANLATWSGTTPGTGVATFLATPSSANLATAITNETGSGALVFGTSPTFTTPIIADGSTLTFDESAADPNDADIALSATDGVFKVAAVNGANNEDLTVDLDQTENTAILGSSTGLTLITTGSIPLNGAIRIVGKGADYTIGTDNPNEAYGSIFMNTAASTRVFTLPSAAAGMSVCVKNLQGVAQILRLDANTGDYIVKSTGARTSATGEYYGATADAKNQLCVVAYDSTDWYVTSEVGVWTEE